MTPEKYQVHDLPTDGWVVPVDDGVNGNATTGPHLPLKSRQEWNHDKDAEWFLLPVHKYIHLVMMMTQIAVVAAVIPCQIDPAPYMY